MEPITVIDNQYATLMYHPDARIVHHELHRFVYSDMFRHVLNQGLMLMKQHGADKWLSDDRFNSALTPEDGAWAVTHWGPRVIDLGWKAWAIVLPDSYIGKQNMQEYIDLYTRRGVMVEVFEDPDEALVWLKTLQPERD